MISLNEYINYSIIVFVSIIKGDGNVSVFIIVIIDEDSEFIFLINLFYFSVILI